MPPPFVLRPAAMVRFFSVSFTPGFTWKTRTALLPLTITRWPLASRRVSVAIVRVLLRVIVPSQANVTVPPPANLARRPASSQLATVAAGSARGVLNAVTSENPTANQLRQALIKCFGQGPLLQALGV